MECPHLEDCVKITAPPSTSAGPEAKWSCSVCENKQSPWLCLQCGLVSCGRYVNAHAKQHYENNGQPQDTHGVCMDCENRAVFCYICDEFVINDTSGQRLEQIRTQLPAAEADGLSAEDDDSSESSEKTQNHTHDNNRKDRKENCNKSLRRKNSECSDKSRKRLKTEKKNCKEKRTSGLRNLGNTCFMNAVLQSLSNIQSFCGYIQQLPSLEQKMAKKKIVTRSCPGGGENIFVVEELRKILVSLWQGPKGPISPESLFSVIWKVVPRFRGYQQQDAHEFMRYLLDRLHTELLTLLPYPDANSPYIGPKGKSTIVTAIFGGILQNEVNCLICQMESKKHDPFLDLSLDIPMKYVRTSKPKDGEPPPPKCHVTDCLRSFVEVEELEESELYRCNNCKLKQRSTKQFWIRRLPNVLCLHLKRFRWNSHFRVKIDTHVEFPIKGLNMNKYVLNNLHETRNSSTSNDYNLAAVIVHHGSGAGSGHYTSYAQHEGRWYHFNDSTVSECDVEVVRKCKAYILFYVRSELKLPHYLNPFKS